MSSARLAFFGLCITGLAALLIGLYGEPHFGIFQHLLYVHDLPAAGLMAIILAFSAMVAPRARFVDCLVAKLARHPLPVIWVTVALLCIGALAVYHNHPLSMDEYAAVFQARVFAAGHLSGHFPPDLVDALVPQRFQNHFLTVGRTSGDVTSTYWPTFSLILAPFTALGIPWACNPVLTGLSLYLIWRMTRELCADETAPGWALLFAVASPALLATGISYYSMQAHLVLNLAYGWLLFQPTPRRLFAAGVVGSLALTLHNPFPHTVFSLPWLLWLIAHADRWRRLSYLLLGYLPLTLMLGLAWMLFQQGLVSGETPPTAADSVGIVASSVSHRATGILPTLLQHFRLPTETIVLARVAGLVKIWLWSAPLLVALAWLGAREPRGDARVKLLTASALTTFFAYFAVPFDQGHGWGYRYFHPAFGTLPLLASLALIRMSQEARRMMGLAAVMSLVLTTAMRAEQIDRFITDHLANLPPMDREQRQVALVTPRGYYAFDLIQNDPWLRHSPILLLSSDVPGQNQARLNTHFPGARHWAQNRNGITYNLPPAQSDIHRPALP